jgi:peptidoglycan/xylan/chitin deacetylase (PgdA/CDA1 family)
MKALLKELFFRFAPHPPLRADRALLLMYHSLSGPSSYFSAISPTEFAWQMSYLAKTKLPVIPLAELVRRHVVGEPLGGCVVITFDDGYIDNYTIGAPILAQYGFPATIFVTVDEIGKIDRHGLMQMSEAQLRGLDRGGLVAIEPHSLSHPKLSRLSRDDAKREIAGSKHRIEELLDKRCAIFAYPKGDFSAETRQLVIDAGFSAAVSVKEGTANPESDRFALPRASIDRSTSRAQFRGKLSAALDWYEYLRLRI